MLGRVYFTGNDCYQICLVVGLILSSLILDSNKNVTDWILMGISSENIKLFDTNLEPIVYNIANGRVILKCNNSILVQNVCLFGAVKLVKNSMKSKFAYNG